MNNFVGRNNSKKKVAFYGNLGSFSHMGAIACFKENNVEFIPCGKIFSDVFNKVINKETDYGVIPVENSSHGVVYEVYDLLLEKKTYVFRESICKIEHNVLVNKGAKISGIRQVYSHVAARNQCKKFLATKKWEFISGADTAGAVQIVKNSGRLDAAAIAGKEAAKIYEMEILKEGIQDYENNFTRFFAISIDRQTEKADKTSIVLGLRNGLSSLYDYLGFFIKRGIKLLNIQCRPAQERPFDYIIYMDLAGSIDDKNMEAAIIDLTKECFFLTYLGSYKSATLK